jgi:hypothetical protein
MNLAREFLRGVVSALKMTSPPLYHYPYRNSLEAFRGDWKHIGEDIEAAFDRFEGASGGEYNES